MMKRINKMHALSLARLGLIAAWMIITQGCATAPKPIESVSSASQQQYQQHQADIQAIKSFSLQGRIGVQTDGKGFSGGIHWQHSDSNDDIALYSPLGGQVASIKKTLGNTTFEDSKGNRISAADAESLTQSLLGWQLPLSGLADWALGRPTSNTIEASTWDEKGYLSTLKQDGWDIEYQNYAAQNAYFLPHKMLLKSQKVNLKLLIELWNPN